MVGETDEIQEDVFSTRAMFKSGNKLNPLAAFLGGVVARSTQSIHGEVHSHWSVLLFDAIEALPPTDTPMEQFAPQNSRYDDNIAVFGKTIQDAVLDSRCGSWGP